MSLPAAGKLTKSESAFSVALLVAMFPVLLIGAVASILWNFLIAGWVLGLEFLEAFHLDWRGRR